MDCKSCDLLEEFEIAEPEASAKEPAATQQRMLSEDPKVPGGIRDVEAIAVNASMCDSERLMPVYRGRRWRKLNGIPFVRAVEEDEFWPEIHWYKFHGIGRHETKAVRKIK